MSNKTKKQLILHIPYVMMGLITTNLGEAWRLAEGTNASEKILSLITTIQTAFANPLPSFHPFDLLIGAGCAVIFRIAVYMKGKNAKKYRHNTEYGSARWSA